MINWLRIEYHAHVNEFRIRLFETQDECQAVVKISDQVILDNTFEGRLKADMACKEAIKEYCEHSIELLEGKDD